MSARAGLLGVMCLLAMLCPSAAAPLSAPETEPLPQAAPPHASRPAHSARRPAEDPQARLDRLYQRLADATSPEEAETIAAIITALRVQAGGDTAELLTSRALDQLKRNDIAAARKLFEAVVAIAPDNAEAWNQLAVIDLREGDFGQAMVDLHQVLHRDPRHWEAWQALGQILEQTGDDVGALAAYRRAFGIDPQFKGLRSRVDRLEIRVNGRQL